MFARSKTLFVFMLRPTFEVSLLVLVPTATLGVAQFLAKLDGQAWTKCFVDVLHHGLLSQIAFV
jgi:hypothetical protein